MKSSLHNLIPFLQFFLSHLRLPSQDTASVLILAEKSTAESLYDRQFTTNQFVLAPRSSSPRPLTNIFFQLNTCGYSLYVTSSLTKGYMSFTITAGPCQRSHSWIQVPRDSWPYFTVSDSRLPPTWRARSPYLYPPDTGWPSYTPKHWAPSSSPPTTPRATVEIFEPASTRGSRWPVIFVI
jgi:hypothetical protein